MEPTESDIQEYLNKVGERRIDEDIQNKLREILKCGICYDVPGEKDIKVRTCEKGHHFCADCFQRLKHCGICRGQFLLGRNFVVEEIITQLGTTFGLTRNDLPPPEQPAILIPGAYPCLHECSSTVASVHMLDHIRKCHSSNLCDDVRSNPYLRAFSCSYELSFALGKLFVTSFHISDMGLFTVVVNTRENFLIGSTHMLSKPPQLTNFQCKLTLKINKTGYSNEFSVSDCDLFDYNYDGGSVVRSEKCLKIDLNYLGSLISEGDIIKIMFSVWRKNPSPKKNATKFTQMTIMPSETVVFKSDRRQRRNKQRNLRKKRNRQAMRQSNKSSDEILGTFRNLSILL